VLAYILYLGLLMELVLYSVGGVLLWQYGEVRPWLAVLMALGLALGVRALILVVMFWYAWIHRAERPAEMRIGFAEVMRLVLAEFSALLVLYGALQPLERWLRRHRHPQGNPHGSLPVLLIHGYFCNGAYWWALERYLQKRGIDNVFTINLEPVFGSIDQYAEQVADRVEQLCALTGAQQVILVGHSMGGLVARAYVHWFEGRHRVAKIITLGSPHHGTESVRLSLVNGRNVRQMHRGSRWLAKLNAAENHPSPVPITSIHSYDDNLVVPHDSSVLNHDHAKNMAVAGVGHLAMAFSRRLRKLIYQEIVEVGGG